MKKVMFFFAVAAMFSFAACNNNTEAEEPATDTAAQIEEPAAAPVDTNAAAQDVDTNAAPAQN